MPQWDTNTRGQNREDEDSYFGDKTDWDGKSCSDFHQLPGRGIRDVEDLTMLSGLAEYDTDADQND
jgi:hypothetical protein